MQDQESHQESSLKTTTAETLLQGVPLYPNPESIPQLDKRALLLNFSHTQDLQQTLPQLVRSENIRGINYQPKKNTEQYSANVGNLARMLSHSKGAQKIGVENPQAFYFILEENMHDFVSDVATKVETGTFSQKELQEVISLIYIVGTQIRGINLDISFASVEEALQKRKNEAGDPRLKEALKSFRTAIGFVRRQLQVSTDLFGQVQQIVEKNPELKSLFFQGVVNESIVSKSMGKISFGNILFSLGEINNFLEKTVLEKSQVIESALKEIGET
jgi:hypothetical protein